MPLETKNKNGEELHRYYTGVAPSQLFRGNSIIDHRRRTFINSLKLSQTKLKSPYAGAKNQKLKIVFIGIWIVFFCIGIVLIFCQRFS